MPLELQVILVGHLVSGCITFMLAVVLWWFAPKGDQPHYRVWAWAWMALAVYSFSGAGSLALGLEAPALGRARLLLSATAQAAGTGGAFLMLFGTLGYARERPVKRSSIVVAMCVAAVVGTAIALGASVGMPTSWRLLYRSGLAAASFLASAAILFRSERGRGKPARLLSVVMVGLGLVYLHYLVYGIASVTGRPPGYSLTVHSLLELPWMAAVVATMAAMALEGQRRWAGDALHRRDAQHHRILESLIAGVYVVRDGRLVYVNPAFANTFGYTPRELVDTDLLALVHAGDRDRVAAHLSALQRDTALSPFYEFRGVRRNGATIHALALCTPMEVDGAPSVVNNLVDITERVWAEERDEILSTLLDAAPTGILVTSETGRVLFSNRKVLDMCGLPPERVSQLTLDEFIDHRDSSTRSSDLATRAARGDVSFEARLACGGHPGVPIQMNVKAVDWHGTPALLSVLTDLTSQKLAQEERERLATAIAQTSEAVVVTDVRGTIQYVNPAFEAVTGYRRAEVVGQNPRVLSSGKHDPGFYRELWDTITHGRTWRGHFTNRRKDGVEFVEEATISPVRDASGTISAFVAVKRDISEELRAQDALTQAQRLESVGRLAGGVAHDFNNLLSIILGYTEMARESMRHTDLAYSDLGQVQGAAERAKALTQQLLAFSRRQVLEPEVFDLAEVLTDIERMLRRLVGEHIDMSLRLPGPLEPVFGDPRQIEQVVMNLVVNARDAMPGGGRLVLEAGMVEVSIDPEPGLEELTPGSYVRVSVSDTGHGMDQDTRERIFEPFFTTKAEGRGTGLGLATVYGIVKQSQGTILVDSEVGRGTTFHVYIPCAGSRKPKLRPRIESRRPIGSETVLLVEDEKDVRRLVERILSGCGYDVLSAASAGDAKVLWDKRDRPVQLLLTDVVMPHMSGPELASHLRADEPGLKVLFMSGYTDEGLAAFGSPDSTAELLTKPFASDELATRVRAVLDR